VTSTQQPTPPSSAAEAETPRPPRAAIVTLCAGGLSASLTQTMVIPVQARFPELLSTSAANATWVITITFLAAAVSMPITGRLADMLGKQRVLVGCAVSLLIGSVLCALGDSLLPVLVGRGLQGVSMGFIPVGIALLREIVPPRYASTSIAAMSATLGVGGAIGLPLAAWIVQEGSWHALFWVSAGVAAAMLTALLTFVPHVHDASPGRFDLPGAVGLATGLTLVLVALSKGGEWGWGSAATLGSLAVGVVVLLAWGVFEMRVDQPLVALRSMARLPVLLTNLAAVVVGLGLMAQALVVPRLLQLPDTLDYGLGQSMLQAGLWMAPGGLMMLAMSPVASRILDGVGPRVALAVGSGVLGTGYVLGFFLAGSPATLLLATLVMSAGVGIGYAAMPALVMGNVPPTEAGSAVSVNTLLRLVGGSLASAVMASVLTGSTRPLGDAAVPTEGAFLACFAIGAVAAFLGMVVALLIPRATPAPTPAPAPVAGQATSSRSPR